MDNLEIAFKLNDQLIAYWQFYVVWAGGVMGWVFLRETAWPMEKRAGVCFLMIMFNIFNITGLYGTTNSLARIVKSLSAKPYILPENVSSEVFQATLERLGTHGWCFHVGPHILADIVVLYFVIVVAGKQPTAQ